MLVVFHFTNRNTTSSSAIQNDNSNFLGPNLVAYFLEDLLKFSADAASILLKTLLVTFSTEKHESTFTFLAGRGFRRFR